MSSPFSLPDVEGEHLWMGVVGTDQFEKPHAGRSPAHPSNKAQRKQPEGCTDCYARIFIRVEFVMKSSLRQGGGASTEPSGWTLSDDFVMSTFHIGHELLACIERQ